MPTPTPEPPPQEPPKDVPVDAHADVPQAAAVVTVEPQSSQGESVANVARDFYGPACESGEEEGAPYRWSVELLQNPPTSKLEGTIKFHACPGGGRAVYRVSGTAVIQTVFTLAGNKVSGGGELYDSAPEQQTFTFDSSSGQLSPNLAP